MIYIGVHSLDMKNSLKRRDSAHERLIASRSANLSKRHPCVFVRNTKATRVGCSYYTCCLGIVLVRLQRCMSLKPYFAAILIPMTLFVSRFKSKAVYYRMLTYHTHLKKDSDDKVAVTFGTVVLHRVRLARNDGVLMSFTQELKCICIFLSWIIDTVLDSLWIPISMVGPDLICP